MIYVAILREIYVGGNNLLRMEELKESVESLGLSVPKRCSDYGELPGKPIYQQMTIRNHSPNVKLLSLTNEIGDA